MNARLNLCMLTVLLSSGCSSWATSKIWSEHGGAFRPVGDRPAIEFDFDRKALTDADIADVVPALRSIGTKQVWLSDQAYVTDAALAHLATLDEVRLLQLTGTQVTPTGLRQLAGMRSLNRVVVDASRFSSDDVKTLETVLSNVLIIRFPINAD